MPSPAARWPVLVYCLLSWAAAFFHLILFSFFKPDVRSSLGLSDSAIGWIDGLTFAATALGGLLLGRLGDRGGHRIPLALAPSLPALGSWLLSEAGSAEAVVAARVLVGLGVGGGWGVGHAVLARVYDGKKLLRAAAILQTGGPLGVTSAALFGAVVAPEGPAAWRAVFALSAITAAIALLDPWAMRRNAGSRLDRRLHHADRRLQPARDWSSSSPPAEPGDPCDGRPATAGPSLTGRVPRAASVIFALLALQMTAYWCTFGWLPSHLMRHGAARAAVGWIQLATGVTQGLADLGFGWLAPRVGLRRLFALCNLAFGAGVLVLMAGFGAVAESPLALAATISAVGLGSGAWAAFGPLYALHVPADVRGTVSSVSYHLARASQLVVQPAVVAMAGTASPHAAALTVAAIAAWAGALAIRWLGPGPAATGGPSTSSSSRNRSPP